MASPSEHAEVERKYEADERLNPAALAGALRDHGRLGTLGDQVTTELDATYYDTGDLRLLGHHITLRRRTGGEDAGWHLKLPVSRDERREVRLPLGEDDGRPPAELLDEVRAYVHGRPLVAVAELVTSRTERHVIADDGTDLAVITEDDVRSRRLVGDVKADTWFEVEVEVVDGKPRVLGELEEVLSGVGLWRSNWPSKLSRALGDRAATARADRPGVRARPARKARTGDVLAAYLREQVDELLACDAPARRDAPDAVHDMRVATRRLRSQLASYRPVLDRERTDPLRDELRWLGQVLGQARDAEVQKERVLQAVDDLSAAEVVGPVRRRVETELSQRHRTAHAELVAALDTARYWELLDRLDALVTAPPLSDLASERAREVVPTLVDKAARRVDRAARRADSAEGHDEWERAVHDVRKAAKRARYAAESAVPVSGRQADRLAERMERLQDVLGEHQDAITTLRLLPELAAASTAAGENAYTFGVLHGVETERARRALAEYPRALRSTQKPKARDWCS